MWFIPPISNHTQEAWLPVHIKGFPQIRTKIVRLVYFTASFFWLFKEKLI